MAVWHIVFVAAALNFPAEGAPAAEIETLKGERHAGELVSLDASAATLKSGENSATVPLADILELRFPANPPPEVSTGARVLLLDGTRLTLSAFTVTDDQARCETSFGNFTLPVARISHVRFGISTTKLDEAWTALLKRDSKNDLLVVKKEDVLDFLSGATGNVGDKIGFLLEGDEVPVARDKVYGIIFHRRPSSLPKSICEVRLSGGDVLSITRFAWEAGHFKVRLATGPDLVIPTGQLAALDFSAGRIVYLSQLEPRDVKYVPFFEAMFYEYRRDRSLDGTPLTLAGKAYARGLALHSKTTLRYRIAGEYSRFQAVAGIDDTVSQLTRRDTEPGPDGKPDERYLSAYVRLVISGDGKPLFDSIVKGTDAPRNLDLNVTDVRDLEILVDFGNNLDTADHLDLANARLVK
jgi:hypothetical protein